MAKTLAPCACSSFVAYTENDNEFTTSCTAQTARTFAPGHDARLKGNLIRWAVLGYEIRVGDVTKSAEGWAESFGFGYMVTAGIRRAADRAATKAAKRIKKATKVEAAPEPTIFEAKVGRWTYEGYLVGSEFVYINKAGETLRTAKFTKI